ncbi:PAS domain-containing protein [Nostoc sp. FACHB-152]|uniref:chemotaxis protein CheB n=1 Tax=unclassified Nostoc TaxID=2593658 RepID=UPI001685DFDD|nr:MULTISPECIES: chemotaxis protein CheB [unclassified Nostoc]MBD2452417.1 PAS domain-containing protein [Nostoc sp. FACHB-152]MBD2469737.1 PAS domain-containing protein [Nostoc sp. FACHB-145]
MTTNQSSESSPLDSIAVEPLTQKQQDQSNELFPIVGIAASAGGLEAFTQLLNSLPIDTGMAFVLIQHLDPNQKSLLTEILAKTTQMPVREVQNGMFVEPNQVYVIPPNTKMTLAQGVLQLMPREKIHGKYMPADAFFTSLAAEIGSKAISVVLSGSDGDGAQGSEAIKAAGGITFAQCEASAQFSSMPNTAIATGDVDFILPPRKIAEELAKIARHPNVTRPISSQTVEPLSKSETALPAIFAMLFTATGVDFTHYKQTTLKRRIARRMVLYNLESLEDYVQYLQNHPDEVQALYYEILISVTSFFRDLDAYQALKQRVFPVITQGKSVDEPIRIWVPGCATGEEVYSIAISLMEFLENVLPKPTIQIFATDINETAIEKARLGIYKPSQIIDVSPERLRRFFNQVESGYQISKPIRELCVFAKQNLISEPPFSNLDLISCRNVLIYFESVLQKQVMPIFHYSLKPTGFLMLGIAESAGEFSNLFTLADRKNNIYTKKLIPTPLIFNFATSNYPVAKIAADKSMSHKTWDIADLNQQADQILLNHYVPVGVMINDNMDILQFRGETSPYLRPAPGVPSFNLFKMARKGLLEELRTAIHQAKRQNVSVRKEQIQMEGGEPSRKVNVEVIPFQPDLVESRCFLVLFEDVPALSNQQLSIKTGNVEPADTQEILRLQQELATTKQELAATQEYLQLISQEHEATTQHLKVANEEILSSNEELQSTNEELQTAKEEVQATNEELHTTNQELQSRNLELHNVNNDLLNLLSSVNIPILILTNDLRIRRFTPTAQRLFNLIPADVGRLLSDIRSTIDVPNLESLFIEVIDTLTVQELETQDLEGRWYNLRIRPYRTTDNQIDGVVMVLMDIDALKRSTNQLQAALDYAEAVVETVPEPLVVLNADLRVIKSNRAFYRMFQVTPAQTEQQLIFELGNGHWNLPQLRSLLEDILTHNTQIEGFEVQQVFEKVGQKTLLLNGYKILQAGNGQMILLAVHDITQQKQFEVERAQLLTQEQSARLEAEASNRTKDEFLSILSHELRNPLHAILGWSELLHGQKLDAAKMNHAIEMIQRSAKAQTQMIESLLDMSRIMTGKLRLNVRTINLAPVIGIALEVVNTSALAKNIQIESRLQPGIGTVLGDPDRLQQIIWNLVSNAIKFTPNGGLVEVTLERVRSQAQIQVSDTGIGISADFLPHIFDRFRQGDSSKTRTNQGLGLGLSIVRHLVELHGGTVYAESPGEGLGTTLTVRLPLNSYLEEHLLPSDAEVIDCLDDPRPSIDEIPSLDGLHILVVDDDADIRNLMIIGLQDYGAEVTAVTSAEEALSILTSKPGMYDVLLSDIGMPNQDGYTLIQQVRSLRAEAGGEIPAAAMTGYTNSIDIQESRKAGFQMHIPKPIKLAELVFMVANLAGRTKNA